LHDEDGIERQQLQHRCLRQSVLKGCERVLRLRRPFEAFLPQQLGEGLGYGIEVLDEVAVITLQAKEGAHHSDRAWSRPIQDCVDLFLVHVTPCAEIVWPRYATELVSNAHFDFLTNKLCSCSFDSTRCTCRRCSDHDELKIRISSKKTSTNCWRKGRKMFIIT
jgi:hypothetical protein